MAGGNNRGRRSLPIVLEVGQAANSGDGGTTPRGRGRPTRQNAQAAQLVADQNLELQRPPLAPQFPAGQWPALVQPVLAQPQAVASALQLPAGQLPALAQAPARHAIVDEALQQQAVAPALQLRAGQPPALAQAPAQLADVDQPPQSQAVAPALQLPAGQLPALAGPQQPIDLPQAQPPQSPILAQAQLPVYGYAMQPPGPSPYAPYNYAYYNGYYPADNGYMPFMYQRQPYVGQQGPAVVEPASSAPVGPMLPQASVGPVQTVPQAQPGPSQIPTQAAAAASAAAPAVAPAVDAEEYVDLHIPNEPLTKTVQRLKTLLEEKHTKLMQSRAYAGTLQGQIKYLQDQIEELIKQMNNRNRYKGNYKKQRWAWD